VYLRAVAVIPLTLPNCREGGEGSTDMTRTWWALLGLAVAALGAALLIERNGGAGEMAELATRWWPVLLVGLGLVNLVRLSNARWAVMGPLLAIIVGTLLLLHILDVLRSDLYPRLWPLLPVIAGTMLVLAAAGHREPPLSDRNDLRRFVWLRGERLESKARAFFHARIGVLLGSYTLDLRQAVLKRPTTIYLTALFGTVEILVDTGTSVTMRRPFVLGIAGLEQSDVPSRPSSQLAVSVIAVFGDARVRRTLAVAPLVGSPGPL
jgi:hypothetical protein